MQSNQRWNHARGSASRLREWLWAATVVSVFLFGVPLRAQTFDNVPAITFVRPVGGLDPLPQTLTLASTGGSLTFSATWSTSSGGDWLTVGGLGCGGTCGTTPEVITASVSSSHSLTAGTYTGQIVITAAHTSLTIPVNLIVAPVATAFFDNLPGALSFTIPTNSSLTPGQMLSVRNGGTGTLNWTSTTSTADGGPWLQVSAANGTAPSLVAVGITVSALPGGGLQTGTFVGQVAFQTSGSQITVPVSVVVGDNVIQQINPISFNKPQGGTGDPLPQTLTIASTGAAITFGASWSTATGGDWLSVQGLGCGGTCGTTPEVITVTVTTLASMLPGTYTGQVVISAITNAITIPVLLTVGKPADTFFDSLPGQLSFTLPTGAATGPPTQQLNIRNAGAGALTWTATEITSESLAWLQLSALNGTAPSLMNVSINVSNLPNGGLVAGTFTGQVLFQSSGGDLATVPVSVVVAADVLNQVNGISFTKLQAGADPLPQTITLGSNGAPITFSATWSTATGGDWLSVQGLGCGGTCGTTPEVITATVTTLPTMLPGTYTGQIVISSTKNSVTIPVTLTVSKPTDAFFDTMPGQMSFTVKTGGPTPPPQTLQIRNAGGGTLNWTATGSTADGQDWLQISPSSGAATSLVTVGINVGNLPNGGLVAGTFTGQILFQAAGTAVTVPVSVVVGANVLSQINAISFTMPQGGANPLPQTLTIAGAGNPVTFNASWSTSTGGDWLSVQGLGCGGVCGTTPEVITATVTTSPTMKPGTYTGQIVISAGSHSVTVPVYLTVGAPTIPFFDNVPGQMSFSLTPGSGDPGSQVVQLRNAGVGELDWTLETSTADGNPWLQASATSGTAPSSVTVNVVASALPNDGLVAGNFIGELTFRSASSSVTLPVSVTVGPAVFVQAAPLTFSKSFGGSNPLPQTLTPTSTGAQFAFTATGNSANGNASNGAPWLSFTGLGCGDVCGTTPENMTIQVAPAVTTAAGTYTGQIVISKGSSAMTVPVYLTVAGAPPTAITIQTSPTGLQFQVDGGTVQNAPQTLNLSRGTHTIAAVTPQAGPTGSQYVFTGWSDSGAASHNITVGATTATYTATFKTQYQLTTAASPAAGGSVSPVSGGFYDAGTVVPLTASANSGFTFSSWSGGVANPASASTSITMSGPESVTAQFSTPQAPPAVTVFSPAQGATGVAPNASLTWGAVAGATSYNVYFGTAPSPPLAFTTAGTSYTPAMSPNTQYYWSVTAVNSVGSTPSAQWQFTTGTQSACTLQLSSNSVNLAATGTATPETCPNQSGQPNCGVAPEIPVSFTVTPVGACGSWTATASNPEFLRITSGASGSGVGTVSYTLVNNTHNSPQNYTIALSSGTASTTYSIAQAGSGDTPVYREVYALYEQLLGRDPDAAGFAFWTGNGGAGLGQMADSFLTSPEAFNSDFAVMATYQAATGLPPTFAQFTASTAAIRSGTQSVPALFNSLVAPGYSAANLYQNLLNRQPGGADSGCVNSGVTACFQTIIGYPSSTTPVGDPNNEFQSTGTFHTAADHTNGLYVQMIYYVTVSRDPDPAGLAFWTGIANNGGPGLLFQGGPGFPTRIQILGPGTPNQGFIGSPEFQGLFAN